MSAYTDILKEKGIKPGQQNIRLAEPPKAPKPVKKKKRKKK